MRGWNSFDEQQRELLMGDMLAFKAAYPNGLGGLYGNPSQPWEVLAQVD